MPPLVHVPAGLDLARPAPLVCMLHGCTQDPGSFAAATAMNDAAERHGFVIVYPAQDRASNAQRCRNWFVPEHQDRGGGEPARIAATVRELIERGPRYTVDPRRVYVAGLSAGGAMALVVAACYPDLFAAVAVHSGVAYRLASDARSAFEAMSGGTANGSARGAALVAAMGRRARAVPSQVIHGSADRTVTPANGRQVLRQSMAANHLVAPERCDHHVDRPTASSISRAPDGYRYRQSRWLDARGHLMHELIEVEGLGHAWSGGVPGGSYADPRGPSATEAIWSFFSQAGPGGGGSKRDPGPGGGGSEPRSGSGRPG